jgi:DnaJ-class molecular chaperone
MTHYQTLGVNENSTQEEIKKAYRKLASQHHPDKGGDTAKFQEIEAAYRTLSDPAKREQYDHDQRNPGGFRFNVNGEDIHQGMPHGMEDILRNFGFNFGGAGNPFSHHNFRQQQPRRNKDLQVRVPVSLTSILQEQKMTVSVQTTKGARENVEITIPRGATNGVQIKYPNLGDNFFETLERGDLYVQVVMQPHPNFDISELDVVTTKNIDCLTAMVGGDVEIESYDGSKFVVNLAPGTQPNQMLRIKEQGVWSLHGSTRGNLLVRIQVSVPRNLSEDQLEAIRKIKSTL